MEGTGNAAYDIREIEEGLRDAARTVVEDYCNTLTTYEQRAMTGLREASREYRLRDAAGDSGSARWTAEEYAEKIDAAAARPADALVSEGDAVERLAGAVKRAEAWAIRPLLNESIYTRERQSALETEAAHGAALLGYVQERADALADAASAETVKDYMTGAGTDAFTPARDVAMERAVLDELVAAQWTDARLREETGASAVAEMAVEADAARATGPTAPVSSD